MQSLLLGILCCVSIVAVAVTSPHEELISLADRSGGHIRLTPATFALLTTGPRHWSATIHLTAEAPRRHCKPCSEFTPSFNAVADAWRSVTKNDRDKHFFATLDLDDEGAGRIFRELQQTSAPAVLVYRKGKGQPSRFDYYGYEAGPLAEALSEYTPVPIPYRKPVNYAKYVLSAVTAISVLVFARFIRPILTSKYFWGPVTIISSIIFSGGIMFVRIRDAPFTKNGSWIAGGYQNQYGQEVQVIAGIYGLLAFSFLMLITMVPYQRNAGTQRLQVYMWSTVIVVAYSVLVVIFKVKYKMYPFRLLV